MAEQRLIDANAVEAGFKELCQSPYFKVDVNAKHGAETLIDLCVRTDSHKPNTIDPETLPIVRQLREELKNEIAKKEICGEIIERLDKQLKKITAERDAAVSDLRGMAIESYSECMYCLYRTAKSFCWNCNDGSNWTWRGPQKEE